MRKINKRNGIVLTIILIIIALIVLGYIGFDLEKISSSPTVQKNFHFVWNFIKGIWENYILVAAKWLFHLMITAAKSAASWIVSIFKKIGSIFQMYLGRSQKIYCVFFVFLNRVEHYQRILYSFYVSKGILCDTINPTHLQQLNT